MKDKVGVPLPSAIRYAKELKDEGILITLEIGNVVFYTSNKTGASFLLEKKLYNLREIYLSGLIDYFKKTLSNPGIVLFGSYSMGEDIESSDIDLYVETFSKKTLELKKFTTTMWFNRSVLSNAVVRTGERLLPVWDLIRTQVLDSFYVRADETTARVLRPGAGATKLVYLWVYVGDDQHPYQLFDYRLDRSRAGPREILDDFQGGLLTDGYSVYTSLVKESDGRLLDLGCWAHARRKFDEACAVSTQPLAHEALAWIWQLYDIEDRLADADVETRRQVRMRESVPILALLHDRLTEVQPTVRPSTKLAEAIGYLLNRWNAMTRFATDGRYAIDNNMAERVIRPSVIGRKNYQFFGSDAGGRAACVWYTLIQSARSNHVHVTPYLNDVLVRLPQIVPEYLRVGDAQTPFESLSRDQREQLSELLPDRWLKAHPEHRSEDRQRELDQANQRRRQRRASRRRLVKI